jgi:hypothetical protein
MAGERFHHDLTLQFGILAEHGKSGEEYLKISEKKIL